MPCWPMVRSAERCAALLLGALLAAAPAVAAPTCDPGLPSLTSDALGYRAREGRCEGRYLREVSGSALIVAGFGEPLPPWGTAAAGVMALSWPVPAQAGEVKLVAQSLRRRVYYRMDTQRPAAPARFAWPRQLAATLVPGAGELGVLASQAGPAQARTQLLPVRLGTAVADRYELVLLPGTEWRELRYSLSTARDDGAAGTVLVKDQALGLGYYPAGRAVRVAIPKALLARTGPYRIDLEAQLDDGGAVVRSLWFTHAAGW